MCIRYVKVDARADRMAERLEELRDRYGDIDLYELDAYPGDPGEFVVEGGEVRAGRWGLQPSWAKDPNFGRRNAYNARGETLAEKPTFRSAFRLRRCVVRAAAFYERAEGRWMRIAPRGEPFAIAGLFEDWDALPTYTMVTTVPNAAIEPVQDRMPVILAERDVPIWLDPRTTPSDLRALIAPCPVEWTTVEDAGPVATGRKKPFGGLFDIGELSGS